MIRNQVTNLAVNCVFVLLKSETFYYDFLKSVRDGHFKRLWRGAVIHEII